MQSLRDLKLFDEIVIRVKGKTDPWGTIESLKDSGFKDFSYGTENRLEDTLDGIALVVVTYDSTVALELFALNQPCCFLFSQKYWPMNLNASKYFDDLSKAAVFHSNEDTLRQHLIANYGDFNNWWFSDEVQQSIKRFQSMYSRCDPDWEMLWAQKINQIRRLN
jgi:putative transferase (TIGR04331 family)